MSPRLPIWVTNSILLCFVFLCCIYGIVAYENQNLRSSYLTLINPANADFATIQEIYRIKNRFPIIYQCHYSFSLQDGTLSESSETVPYEIYKKLKLGDGIEIYRKETTLFGRRIAVSKIRNNQEAPPLLENLERYFQGGVAYFAVAVLLTLLFMVWGLPSRIYPHRRK